LRFIRLCPFNPFDPFFTLLVPARAAVANVERDYAMQALTIDGTD
jgi:hypothetical protein